MYDNVATLAMALENGRFNAGLKESMGLMNQMGLQAQGLNNVAQTAIRSFTALYASSKAVGFFKDAIASANAYREDLAQFQWIFRNVSKASEEMVKTLTSADYGRTTQQAMKMTMNLASMIKGMGIADKSATKLTEDFAKMAVDIGSFTMKDPMDVMNAFQSSMMGFNQALRPYGVFLTEATLKATILANAKKGMIFANEREARTYAILSEVQRQQADAMGDFAVESQKFTGQLRKLKAGIEDLTQKIGTPLMEASTKFLTVLNTGIDYLKSFDKETYAVIATVGALGTGLTVIGGTYTAVQSVLTAYRACQAVAAAATAQNTANITAQTAAMTANTAAAAANTAAHGTRSAGQAANATTMNDSSPET
ncbi:hypothetical protein FACS189419_05020 [Planctomycetales bacterium]|nr:hypothetical protein FACS189419_05020 [Planctomycetales bacterium]